MWQVIDLSSNTIVDEFDTRPEAVKERDHLNAIHNPPCYTVRKVK